MRDWTMEIARRNKGAERFVNDWVVEKLCKVVQAIAELHHSDIYQWLEAEAYNQASTEVWEVLDSATYDAYRNACKLAAWIGGNIGVWTEDRCEVAFREGAAEVMCQYVEQLLAPVLANKPAGP